MIGADTVCDGTETAVEPIPAVLIEYDQIRGWFRMSSLGESEIAGAEPVFSDWRSLDEVSQ